MKRVFPRLVHVLYRHSFVHTFLQIFILRCSVMEMRTSGPWASVKRGVKAPQSPISLIETGTFIHLKERAFFYQVLYNSLACLGVAKFWLTSLKLYFVGTEKTYKLTHLTMNYRLTKMINLVACIHEVH